VRLADPVAFGVGMNNSGSLRWETSDNLSHYPKTRKKDKRANDVLRWCRSPNHKTGDLPVPDFSVILKTSFPCLTDFIPIRLIRNYYLALATPSMCALD
jgi:hypothetical protein